MNQTRQLHSKHIALTIGLFGLAVVALVVRVWGVGWSLPYVDHPDEPAVVNVVLRLVSGERNPNFFFYPSLMLYALTAVFKLHFWLGLRDGLYTAPLQLPTTTDFYTAIPQAYIWGRVLCAALGAATVAILAGCGSIVAGRRAAIVGAALLLVAPFAVTHAHYIAVDVPSALTATLGVLAAVNVLRHGTWRTYIIAGIAIGLAAATKYQSVLVCFPVALAHVLYWRGQSLHMAARLVVAALLSALVFVVCSPFIVLDWAAFSRDITTLFRSYGGSHGDVQGAWPIGAYAERIWSQLLGPIPSVLALVGAAVMGRKRPAVLAVILTFPMILLVVLLRAETHFFRNLLPIQPTLLLLAGAGCVGAWDALRSRIPLPLSFPAALVGITLIVLPSAVKTAAVARNFALPDSRVVIQQQLRRDYPGMRIASELSHPFVWGGIRQATPVHYLPLHDLAWYQEQGFGLLLADSGARRAYTWPADYDTLRGSTQHITTLGGPDSAYRGPQMDVFDTHLASSPVLMDTSPSRIGTIELAGITTGRRYDGAAGPQFDSTTQLKAGEVMAINLFWRAQDVPHATNEQMFVHVRNQEEQNVAQIDTPPWHGLFPLTSWPPHRLVTDSIDLPLPATLPPGAYRLVMGLYDTTTFARFPASRNGIPLPGDEVELATIEIVP